MNRLATWRRKRRWNQLLQHLDTLQFFHYMQPDVRATHRKFLAANPFASIYDLFNGTSRIYPALYKEPPDPGWMSQVLESLYAGSLGPGLLKGPIEERRTSAGLTVSVGNHLWELEMKNADTDDELQNDLSERRFLLQVINDLLQHAALPEQAWHIWGEKSESLYVLLTQEQCQTIVESELIRDPITPTINYP